MKRAEIQPPDDIEFHTVDDVAIKVLIVAKAGTIIPKHSHPYEHGFFVAGGAFRVWQDDRLEADYHAPTLITVKAGVKHLFQALEDNSYGLCIHNTMRKEIVEILERNDIVTET